MFWPVPLGLMLFANKQFGEEPVIMGGPPENDWNSSQALPPGSEVGLVPVGDRM